ncbi:ABC transporter permease [Bacillus sp. DX1.1]|uniref:ABC transporter permease n=1 Tax=unclassified Bacillus (in: firmicutes) TaxID=185979 RepID=UPI00256FD008|nr:MULTISPECIES: ABC transporter permease [unclassified Bacillus (in: firmicutes)]MDM5154784.1 ABC transporter permease [Bacillus sp. DX1.1]WJE83662.1 ABC transporter permease [Bacillus sp. DX3.1]
MIKKQFYKRLFYEFHMKWKSIRSVTDWTVALYIIIPALVFSGIYYRSLWTKELSVEETIYFSLGLLVFYFVTFSRGTRSFFEQADSLFLIQHPSHMKKLMRYGTMYTFVRISITNVIVTMAMLPVFLKNMDASILQVLLFWLFFTVFRCMVSLLVRYVDVRIGKRWVLWIVKNMLFLIGLICFGSGMFFVFKNPICSIPFIVIFILISVALIKKKMNYQRFFFKEVEKEKAESMRWTMDIMQFGGHVIKPSNTTSKPWVFPRSKRILGRKSDSRIVESFLKEYFRTGNSLGFYIRIVLISALAITRTPWWITSIILVFSLFAIARYSRDRWSEFTKKMFLQLYCNEGRLVWLRWKSSQYLFLPALFIYGTVILAQFYLLPAIIIGIILVILVGWIVFIP